MPCKVCKHPFKGNIERLIRAGRSAREISKLFDDVSYRTVYRHMNECMLKNKNGKYILEQSPEIDSEGNFLSTGVESSSGTICVSSLVKEICDSLEDIDLDAKELFILQKKDGNLEDAEGKLQTRMQIQNMKINLVKIATQNRTEKRGVKNNDSEPMKEAETIPAEVEEVLNQ